MLPNNSHNPFFPILKVLSRPLTGPRVTILKPLRGLPSLRKENLRKTTLGCKMQWKHFMLRLLQLRQLAAPQKWPPQYHRLSMGCWQVHVCLCVFNCDSLLPATMHADVAEICVLHHKHMVTVLQLPQNEPVEQSVSFIAICWKHICNPTIYIQCCPCRFSFEWDQAQPRYWPLYCSQPHLLASAE